MKVDIQIHKKSGRRGGIVKAGTVRWGKRDRAHFDVVTLDLTPEQIDDVRHERLRVHADEQIEAVPPKDWPEEKRQAIELEQFLRESTKARSR